MLLKERDVCLISLLGHLASFPIRNPTHSSVICSFCIALPHLRLHGWHFHSQMRAQSKPVFEWHIEHRIITELSGHAQSICPTRGPILFATIAITISIKLIATHRWLWCEVLPSTGNSWLPGIESHKGKCVCNLWPASFPSYSPVLFLLSFSLLIFI